ncbi:MAG: hypothetical protein EOP48_19020 [Sphingobacteriales bacterium]|nr:MAG: hypothetical protein EOP48_19020 [Sphingobacteriales bacterium]
MQVSKPTRPWEVVCLFPVSFPTKEGDLYVYIAKDVYSEVILQTGVEESNTVEFFIKNIQSLMSHTNFADNKRKRFTLVLHKYKQHRTEIESIIAPLGGYLFINDTYLSEQIVPVIEQLYASLKKG